MGQAPFRIGVIAASSRFPREIAERLTAHVAARRPDAALVFHPDAFAVSGHFAGDDAARARAVLAIANDPAIDAVWFGRGGYGAARITPAVMAGVKAAARAKPWLGYSDAGALLGGLYRAGLTQLAHGPMGADILRPGGEAAVDRALSWLVERDPAALEPHLDDRPAAAFNLAVLDSIVGTELEPDLGGHVLMLEEVSEPLYRIDRMMGHLTGQASIRRAAGVRLGRVGDIIANDPPFGQTPEDIARFWCERAGLAFLGGADIGHDAANRVVPFGRRG